MRLRYPFAMECGVYRTSYEQDLMLHHTPLAQARLYGIYALLYLLPLALSKYQISVLNQVIFFSVGALGLNLLTGFAGQISLGHGAFTGVGAFTVGYLMTKAGWSYWAALPMAGLMAAAVGALFGLPSARLKGLYLAIASMAAQVILQFVFIRAEKLTGGVNSMSVPRPKLLGFEFTGEVRFYYLALTIAIGLFIFAQNLFRTRVGRALVAIRDRDLAAEVMGVDLWKYKVLAFATSSFYAGIAGALWAPYVMIINPEQFDFHLSIELLAMIIIGGLGSIMGSIYGAVFMTVLPIVVRNAATVLANLFPDVANKLLLLRDISFGMAIILFLVFESEGLAKLWRNIKDYFRLWPFSY